VESAMLSRQQQYRTVQQTECLMELIMSAMLSGTPIPHASLVSCDDVSIADLIIHFPNVPADPAVCPSPQDSDPRCAGQFDTRLSAYWDAGGCGPQGNDHNWDWCNRDAGDPASECATSVEVATDICASGHASLESTQGTGQCCSSVVIDGCNYAYYAQYVCSDACTEFSWALPSDWSIEASTQWDANYAPDNVKVREGRPWHSGRDDSFPQDLTFDAGQVVTMNAFATGHPPSGWAGSAMQAYTFSQSDDGVQFSEVVSGTGTNLGGGARQEIEFPSTASRYWRLHMSSNYGYHRLLTAQYVEFRTCAN